MPGDGEAVSPSTSRSSPAPFQTVPVGAGEADLARRHGVEATVESEAGALISAVASNSSAAPSDEHERARTRYGASVEFDADLTGLDARRGGQVDRPQAGVALQRLEQRRQARRN